MFTKRPFKVANQRCSQIQAGQTHVCFHMTIKRTCIRTCMMKGTGAIAPAGGHSIRYRTYTVGLYGQTGPPEPPFSMRSEESDRPWPPNPPIPANTHDFTKRIIYTMGGDLGGLGDGPKI